MGENEQYRPAVRKLAEEGEGYLHIYSDKCILCNCGASDDAIHLFICTVASPDLHGTAYHSSPHFGSHEHAHHISQLFSTVHATTGQLEESHKFKQ